MFQNLPIPFLILSFLTILSSLYVVTSKNPVHSVLALIFTFFTISAHYVLLNAQFLAVVNLIVYAGAIMVLFLFVLMLLNLSKETEPVKSNWWGIAAAITAGSMLLIITAAFQVTGEAVAKNPVEGIGLVKALGKVLFTRFVVPFELTGILFLAAMVGAVLLGKREKNNAVLIPKEEGGNS
ncbi:MAG: NADH-quinone oxidoreductase subunit J [Bacteroidota bacterium]|jgi:NADH-quinone oxidoreductase subunit J